MQGSLLAGRKCNCAAQLVGGTVVWCLPQGACLTLRIFPEHLFNKVKRICPRREVTAKEKKGCCSNVLGLEQYPMMST